SFPLTSAWARSACFRRRRGDNAKRRRSLSRTCSQFEQRRRRTSGRSARISREYWLQSISEFSTYVKEKTACGRRGLRVELHARQHAKTLDLLAWLTLGRDSHD